MRRSVACALLFIPLWTINACGDETEPKDPVCNAGDFVFCRCENGLEGTKKCHDDGMGFDECRLSAKRACPDDSTTAGGGGAGGAGGSIGEGGGTTTTSTTNTTTTTTGMGGEGEGGFAPVVPWINEVHYDNNSTDFDEGVEIVGPANMDLLGWSVVYYNATNGNPYLTTLLEGVFPNEQNGVGARWFPQPGLQNGSPDGFALVDDFGFVVVFLSYEGVFTAQTGPAAGMTSVDIVASEPDTTAAGLSLQLTGSGSAYSDFTWQPPSQASPGSLNSGQTIAF
jgi:hypothetical protein